MREAGKLKVKRAPVLWLATALALLLSLGMSDASGQARPGEGGSQPPELLNGNCHELIARLAVAEDAFHLVDDAVPERFEEMRDPLDFDRAHLVVRSSVCERLALTDGEVVTDGDPGPGLQAQVGVEIQSPDGVQNLDNTFACCDWYTLFWVTDDRDVAAWLKGSSGLGAKARYVEDLSLTYNRVTGGPYGFHAGDPTPSPYDVAALAARPIDREHHIEIAWWIEKDDGALKFYSSHDDIQLGTAAGSVTPRAGSQLASLLSGSPSACADDPARFCFGPDPFASDGWTGDALQSKVFVACGGRCHPPSSGLPQ